MNTARLQINGINIKLKGLFFINTQMAISDIELD